MPTATGGLCAFHFSRLAVRQGPEGKAPHGAEQCGGSLRHGSLLPLAGVSGTSVSLSPSFLNSKREVIFLLWVIHVILVVSKRNECRCKHTESNKMLCNVKVITNTSTTLTLHARHCSQLSTCSNSLSTTLWEGCS